MANLANSNGNTGKIAGLPTLASGGTRVEPFLYSNFQGLDTSRDAAALDSGERQHLTHISNGYVDWRGIIIRDPAAEKRGASSDLITHVTFFGRDLGVWADRMKGGVRLRSERGHKTDILYPRSAVITSTNFNQKAIFASKDGPMYSYNGMKFEEVQTASKVRPAYVCAIQRRLAIAGMQDKAREVWLSRVDDESIMPPDEAANEASVLRAGRIDISNLIGTSDEIRGIGQFERNRLAIFTHDQTLVYRVTPDLDYWEIDERANVRIGCVSHNTIVQAGTDLLFCSRTGAHSLRRSVENGVTIFALNMSQKVELLYRELLRSCKNPEEISAYFDQDNGQYHIFIPQTDLICTRLTASIAPTDDEGYGGVKWSTGNHLSARCGATLGGITLLGTPHGLYQRMQVEDELENTPELVVETPILWHGGINTVKRSHSMIIQAAGKGSLLIEAFDDTGRRLTSIPVDIDGDDGDGVFNDVPLVRQYEKKFEHQYRGVRLRFTSKGSGLFRLIGFAINVKVGKNG